MEKESHRHATWLEIFYDLIWIVAIAELSRRASQDPSPSGLLQCAFLFLPIAWGWVGHTVYSTRFDNDDFTHRALTLLQMLAALGMALTIRGALEGLSVGFAVSYLTVRCILLLLYTRAYMRMPLARPMISLYLWGFGAGVAVWAASLFADPPLRFALWGLSLAIDFMAPWIGVRMLNRSPVHSRHLPERFGLFTIILLGENFLMAAHTLEGSAWSALSVVTAAIAFFPVATTWWLYFLYIQEWEGSPSIRGGQPFIYLHFLIWLGMLASIVGIEHLLHDLNHAGPPLVHALLFGGIALWLCATGGVDIVLKGPERHLLWLPFGMAAVALLTGLLTVNSTPIISFGALMLILFLHIAIEERRRHGHAFWRHH